jgi:predicted Zn-dependent protease
MKNSSPILAQRALRLACILVSFSLMAGCGYNRVTKTPEISVTSKARERKLGLKEAKKVEVMMGLVDDRPLSEYVTSIGGKLVKALPAQDMAYTFKVVDSQVPNAFALPGGYVYITRGMLALLNTEDELACILGHEIAHVAARHSVRQHTRRILTSPFTIATGIAGAATGIILPRVGGLISGAGSVTTGAVLASYSRDQEREADRIGMDLAAGSGWQPSGMTDMLITLERNEKLVTGHVKGTGFLDSHPSTPERSAAAIERASGLKIAPSQAIAVDRGAFFTRLDGILVGANPDEGVFVGQRFMQPEMNFQLDFPKGWELHNARAGVGAAEPNQRGVILLQLAGEAGDGVDPLVAAHARRNQFGFRLEDVTKTTINGLPAARVDVDVSSRKGPAKILITWIIFEKRIYEMMGLTRPEHFKQLEPVFIAAGDSFAALESASRAKIKAERMASTTSKGGETVHSLLDRANSIWSPATAAMANAVPETGPLPTGLAMKAPVAVPYTSK